MKLFGNMKIKEKLFVLIGIAIFIITTVQAVYYIKIQTLIKDKTQNHIENMVGQFEESLGNTLLAVKKAGTSLAYSNYIQEYLNTTDTIEKMRVNNIITENIKYIIDSSEDIVDMGIYDIKKDSLRFFMGDASDLIFSLEKKYNFKDMKESFAVLSDDREYTANSTYAYFIPTYDISDSSKIMNKTGVVVVICDAGNIKRIIDKADLTGRVTFYISDHLNKVFLSNQPGLFHVEDSSNERGKSSVGVKRKVKETGWTIVMEVPVNVILEDLDFYKNSIFIVGFIMIILLLGIGTDINKSITKPVIKMINSINGIGKKGIHERLEKVGQNEIDVIVDSINYMLDKIEDMTKKIFSTQDKLYSIEFKKKEAEISTLRNQINPHFLYNTLECIRSIGKCNDIDEIVSITTAMADILRYSIKGDNYVKITDEVEIAKKYLQIMNIRFNGKIKSDIKIDEGLMEKKTIKMVLQPIIENAIYHGLGRKKNSGELKIQVTKYDGIICISVEDDGKGIERQQLASIKKMLVNETELFDSSSNSSIGIINIHRRIQLLYGNKYGIDIWSRVNQGTRISIKLPC